MSFVAECPFCRIKLQGVPDHRAGGSVECPRCHNLFTLAAMVNPPKLRPRPLQAAALASATAAPTAEAKPVVQTEELSVRVTQSDEGTVRLSRAELQPGPDQETASLQPRLPDFAHPPVKKSHAPSPRPEGWEVNGFGLASFLLGGLALAIASLSYVGMLAMPLSGLGVFLAFLGIVTAPKKGGMIYPIAGLTVCLPVLVILIFSPGLLGGRPFALSWSKKQDAGGTVVHLPRQGRGWHVAVNEQEWMDASKGSLTRDGVRLKISAVAVQPVETKDAKTGRTASERCLAISLKISNVDGLRKINYASWAESAPSGQKGSPSLLDNLGRNYRRKKVSSDPDRTGHSRTATIDPGEAVEEVLVFEAPPQEIAFLSLELPGSALGVSGVFKLEIPRQMISYP
jgi:hypothetical protein